MNSLLNRALNFSVLPLKLDITQLLVDFNRFARASIWQEYWYEREQDEPFKKPIFKARKNNLPKKHNTPNGLKIFLNSIRSEIMDPKNRNEEKCNLPESEINALKELIKLQKERVIIIKAADKGAGIVILDFKDYVKACYTHLLSNIPNQTNNIEEEPQMYYKAVHEFALEEAKSKITETLKEALEQEIITETEYTAMNPEDKNPSKFYCNFKVHKQTEHGEIPPVRPIISGSGAITENISVFVEHHIVDLSTKHQSYLQDTPHFLRVVNKINQGPRLPANAVLVTADITGAYSNIPQEDGSQCLREELDERKDKTIPTEFLVKLMDLIQKYNIFEFHDGQLWKQLVGVAMGIHPAPSFANIYLARRLDRAIRTIAEKYGENGSSAFQIFKRFLDDLFQIFKGTTKQLHKMYEEINNIHPTLKFTLTHTTIESEPEEDRCNCEPLKSIPFLDTSLSIENGKIEIDLYRKKTDRNQYLLPSSCLPKTTTQSIPYSLVLKIVRICTKPKVRDKRLDELKELLLAREYPESLINRGIEKARKVPRMVALLKVKKKERDNQTIFALKFDPRIPSIQQISSKHWRSMTMQNKYLKECFPKPPLIAYRRQANLRNFLIKSKLPSPPGRYPSRNLKGMKKCGKSCTACPYILEGKNIKIDERTTWNIEKNVSCTSFNVIYLLECKRCRLRYIGTTGRQLKHRLAEHRGYITNQVVNTATGAHYNLPGHSLADLKVTILEQTKSSDEDYRLEREKYFIRKFDAFNKGLNREW